MKKLFKEENNGFHPDPGRRQPKLGFRNLTLILILFLFNENLFSQIPINGFCKYNYFKVDTGFTNLLPVNFNNDAYTDFVFFNPQKKEVLTVKGSLQGNFIDKKKYSVPSEINSIQPVNNKTSSRFIFTNRKERKAGLYEFNKNGKPSLVTTTGFDSYPEYLSTADVDGSGRNEILISGGGFNGISLLYQQERKLVEKNIVNDEAFSQAIFIDLNNDGYSDIAAYNLLNRSFVYFYNNSKGEFRKVRSINLTEKPANIKTFDLNLDLYEDLTFTAGNSIYIWYGDFRASYENTKKIITKYKPDKLIYSDFNKDGLIDLAYLNIENSLISVLIGKNEFDYYPEIIYLKQSGLRDIVPYYSRFINGIAALSIEGSLHTITNLSSFADMVSLSIGAKPGAIAFFDNEDNGINNFCFIDEFDKKIKFILRDNTGIPAVYFSQQLSEVHEKIVPENFKADEKNYICFSYKKKIIEVVKVGFGNSQVNKTVLYSPGSIIDLKVKRDKDNEYKIYVLYQNALGFNFGVFHYRNMKFNFTTQLIDDAAPYDASLGINPNLNVYYWAKENKKTSLLSRNFGNPGETSEEKFSLKDTIPNIISFTGDLLNMEKNVSISFISEKNNNYTIIAAETFTSEVKDPGSFRITSKNNLFFGETRFNGLKKLSVYLPERNIFYRLEFIKKGKDVVMTKIIDASEAGSFFIKNMTSKNYHLVYTDIEKGCITIKRIKS